MTRYHPTDDSETIVEAERYDGFAMPSLIDLSPDRPNESALMPLPLESGEPVTMTLMVTFRWGGEPIHGQIPVQPGEWIVRDANGQIGQPMADEVFRSSYEEVSS